MMIKPYSSACDQNRQPIERVLANHLGQRTRLLELSSGTGQHAVYFSAALPQITWQPSDVEPAIAGIQAWVNEAALPNILTPIALNVDGDWPGSSYDVVFSANAVHIMGWDSVLAMFKGIDRVLERGGLLFLYGPFNYHGKFTSESNAGFDVWLKQRDPVSGVRDFEALDLLANQQGMHLLADHEMPANNRTLVWEKD
ncbi:MAG: DUF938 domain-containing protein [Gammaproteobacteria bacterium]|nr:DUF938 domain-containing protein [Gammaproteobacteria bacterium]